MKGPSFTNFLKLFYIWLKSTHCVLAIPSFHYLSVETHADIFVLDHELSQSLIGAVEAPKVHFEPP